MPTGEKTHKRYTRIILPNGIEVELDNKTETFMYFIPQKYWESCDKIYQYDNDDEYEKIRSKSL